MPASLLGALALLSVQTDSVGARLRAAELAIERGQGDSAWAAASTAANRPGAGRLALLTAGMVGAATFRPEAADYLERTVPANPAADDQIAVEATNWLAEVRRRRGAARESELLWRRAATSAERLGLRTTWSESLVYLAGATLRRGDPPGALAILDSAELVLPGGAAASRARVACQRATVLAFLSRHAAADSSARRGATLAREAEDGRRYGQCLAILGSAQAQRNDFIAAADTLGLAAGALRAAHDDRTLAATLQWRGYVLRMLARLGEATTDLTEALAVAGRVGDRNTAGWAHLNLGQVAANFGDQGGASEAWASAVAAFEGIGDAWGEHSTLLSLAGSRRALGLLDEAERDARAVLGWAQQVGNADLHFGAWRQLGLQAEHRGQIPLALARADSAETVARSANLVGSLLAIRYVRARLLLAQGRPERALPLLEAYQAGLDSTAHLRRYAARARIAEGLVALGETGRAGAMLETAMQSLDAWRGSLDAASLRQAVFSANADDEDADLGVATVIAALAGAGDLERAFALAERRRARELGDRLVRVAASAIRGSAGTGGRPVVGDLVTLPEARAQLDPGTVLLVFVTGRGGEPSTMFLVHREGVALRRLAPVDSLRGDVSRAQALLAAGDPIPDGLARRLGEALVAPWLDAVPASAARVVIVPDDVLHHVPFALLPTADGRPVASRLAVAYAPSASSLLALRRRSAPTAAPILALADPSLSAPGDASALSRDGSTEWSRLPGARSEARGIARQIADVRVLTGRKATESRAKSPEAGVAAVIHLASHAVVDERSPLGSFVLLAPAADEDGRLTAAEIEQLELRAELVVLSACRTATGRLLAGEGVQGLTAPLLAAGARAVVASRWDVDDDATARLMGDFYRALLAGEAVADALNAAKRLAMERGESPSVWGAFSVVGDPLARPLLQPRKRPSVALLLLVGLALVAALALARSRRALRG